MSWHDMNLGDAIHVKHGFAFKSRFFDEDGDHTVLTPGNFHEEGGFRLRPEKDRAYVGDVPEGYILGEGDLIVAMTEQGPGLLGSSALIPESNRFLHNQRLGLVDEIDHQKLDKRFLYYLFNTHSVRGQISGSASGTKVRHTSPERIYRVRVRVPDVPTQQCIAETLSAYDDLIENNRRRMALLEEATRQLYREWFVRLRFPGHEHTRITDGVPEGWGRAKVQDLAEIRGGKQLENERIAKEGPAPVFGGNGVQGYTTEKTHDGFVIVFGRVGANCGSIHWSYNGAWVNNNASGIVPKENPELLLHHLLDFDFTNLRKGAAQPFIPNGVLATVEFWIPSHTMAELFCETVRPCRLQQETLARAIQKFRAARDLLLPQLMSGELVV